VNEVAQENKEGPLADDTILTQVTAPDVETARDALARGSEQVRPVLIVLTGLQEGAIFGVYGPETVIGRGHRAEIEMHDDGVSRRHCVVTCDNIDVPDEVPRCFIEDLGSSNGTQLNAGRVTGRMPLSQKDRITIGSTVLGFFLRSESELRRNESMYEWATRDALTGLDNRHQFLCGLRHHLALAKRRGETLALLLIDVDHFKRVNDRYGHEVGDKALRHLAGVMRGCVRPSEMMARWGGEEFAVIVPGTKAGESAALGERIRAAVAESPLSESEQTIDLAVSIGVTSLRPGDTVNSMFERADRRLYGAKEQGRNRVVVDDEGE
jgi:diguanylate cyclase (GGDEF)-like protein